MNKAAVSQAFELINDVFTQLPISRFRMIKSIHFDETLRVSNTPFPDHHVLRYDVSLHIFFDDKTFCVTILDIDNMPQTYDNLIKKAVEKLKQIANEKTR